MCSLGFDVTFTYLVFAIFAIFLDTEDHDYVREHCPVPSHCLKTFAQVHGARVARLFAENYQPVSTGRSRAISGVLLFGPSGAGKSLLAQAICAHIGGTFYSLSASDLPNGKAGAQRIDAPFDVEASFSFFIFC